MAAGDCGSADRRIGATRMAVESENVQTLMEWLAQGSPVRSALPAAEALIEKLVAVVFQGDAQWTDRRDHADDYRDTLSAWLAADSGHEQQFAALTTPGADPGMFVDWFLPVVARWESVAAGQQSAATQDNGDVAAAEPGRYSEPARDDAYGLIYRYDHQTGVYEWYDEASQIWQDQAWADQHTTGGPGATTHTPADDSPAGPAPGWDENWKMFYRVDANGAYQFADALIPGDKSSGWDEQWLSQEQVVARTSAPQPTATPAATATATDPHGALGAKVQKPATPHVAGSAHAQTHPASAGQAGARQTRQPATVPAEGHEDPALSGAHWSQLFPSLGNDITHLDADFGQRVAHFIAAMEDAGIEVVVVGARRSPQRAYLMHWSYKIFKGGTSAQEADLPNNRLAGVDIRWAHTDKDGAYDPKASVEGAKSLYHALGIAESLGVAPSLTSNHIAGRAVDMTTTWHKDSITIRKADGTDVVITTASAGERSDNNPDLHDVAESYGIVHFASQKGAKSLPAGDKNHWSYNGR